MIDGYVCFLRVLLVNFFFFFLLLVNFLCEGASDKYFSYAGRLWSLLHILLWFCHLFCGAAL